MKHAFSSSHHWNWYPLQTIAVLLVSSLFVALTACGDGGSSTNPPTPPANSTTVQVNLGDGPADLMLAFSMNISSLNLMTTSGSVPVISASTPVEMIHRLGTMDPLAMVSVPQGNYTGATITIASCSITYLDPNSTTKTPLQKTIQGPITAAIPFASAVTVGTTPLAFNFDLDLENSVTMDNTGKFQLSPQFHTAVGPQGAGNGNGARNGGMQQMMGVVSNVSSNSFSITPLQATNTFTFMVNAQTQFQGNVTAMNMVRTGMGVLVTAALQPDGTLLATRVRSKMNAGGIMGGGIITNVVGQPATQLSIVMQNGAGASVMTSYLSQILTVNLTPDTEYEIDSDRVTLTGLPFTPVFNASNIYAGQSVLPTSESTGITVSGTSGTTAGTITASNVRLQEQGFRGTTDKDITPASSGSFVLTLMPGCAFTTLTGAKTILVYQQTTTNVQDNTAIPAGATLRVHGLLFNNGGQWTLIASTISSL